MSQPFSLWKPLPFKHDWAGSIGCALMLMAPRVATAQDSLRNSLAGDAAAEAQRQQLMSQLYTFKVGDFKLLAAPSMEVDWNNNVNLVKSNAESDVILEPALQLAGRYPLTQRNLLSVNVGVSYWDYLRYTTNSGFRLTSDSLVAFDTYIKDFIINVHDRFSLTEDPATEPGIAGTSTYGTFQNSGGLTTSWDLRDMVLTVGYDHLNYISSSQQFNYDDHTSELPLARAGIRLGPDVTAGVEGTASFTSYEQAVLNNYQSYSVGLYGDWREASFRVQPRIGYTVYDFQHTGQTPISTYTFFPYLPPVSVQTLSFQTWYADLTVADQLTKAMSLSLGVGHEVRPGIESDAIEDYYFRPSLNWTVLKDFTLNTSIFYEHGNQGIGNVAGNLVENYNYVGAQWIASYPLTKKLLLSLTYRLTVRSSDVSSQEYTQNLAGIRLTYKLQ